MGHSGSNAVPTITEARIYVAQQEFPLDPLRPGRQPLQLFSSWFIAKQIEGPPGSYEGVVHHHRRNQVFEIAIRPGDEGGDNQPKITTIVLTCTDGWDGERCDVCLNQIGARETEHQQEQ